MRASLTLTHGERPPERDVGTGEQGPCRESFVHGPCRKARRRSGRSSEDRGGRPKACGAHLWLGSRGTPTRDPLSALQCHRITCLCGAEHGGSRGEGAGFLRDAHPSSAGAPASGCVSPVARVVRSGGRCHRAVAGRSSLPAGRMQPSELASPPAPTGHRRWPC